MTLICILASPVLLALSVVALLHLTVDPRRAVVVREMRIDDYKGRSW